LFFILNPHWLQILMSVRTQRYANHAWAATATIFLETTSAGARKECTATLISTAAASSSSPQQVRATGFSCLDDPFADIVRTYVACKKDHNSVCVFTFSGLIFGLTIASGPALLLLVLGILFLLRKQGRLNNFTARGQGRD
jgi:hypothetical protein